MRFSASRIKLWMDCSQAAYYRYHEHHPTEQSGAASFGTVIHHVLELQAQGGWTEEALVKRFEELWYEPGLLGVEPDFYHQRTSWSEYRALGVEVIKSYCRQYRLEDREVIATEYPFLVHMGKHELTGFVDLLEVRKNHRGKKTLQIIDLKTAGKQPTKAQLAMDVQFCADEETEILTSSGWRRHDQVFAGDRVLTLNTDTYLAEWQTADSIHVFDAMDQEMLSMEGKAHSSLTTLNHRWPVRHTVASKKGWRNENRVVTSENLRSGDAVLCAAPVTNLPVEPKYSDEIVEVVAWAWTEGSVRDSGHLVISQSEKVNPNMVARIRNALSGTFGTSVPSFPRTGGKTDGVPRWREETDEHEIVRFYLNIDASRVVTDFFDGEVKRKVVASDFLANLTPAQLQLYIDVSIWADGSSNNGSRLIAQTDRSRLDSFQMACTLAGIRTSLRYRPVGGTGRYAEYDRWILSLKEREPWFITHRRTQSRVQYTGKVWCPSTANGTWMARRGGHVYFTGNTVYCYASLQKEFWAGVEGNPDFPGLPDGEELYERFLDMPRRAIWRHLRTQRDIDAGDRTDEDFERLHLVLNEIEKADVAGVHVPRVSEACGLCDYSSICRAKIPDSFDIDPEDDNSWL